MREKGAKYKPSPPQKLSLFGLNPLHVPPPSKPAGPYSIQYPHPKKLHLQPSAPVSHLSLVQPMALTFSMVQQIDILCLLKIQS